MEDDSRNSPWVISKRFKNMIKIHHYSFNIYLQPRNINLIRINVGYETLSDIKKDERNIIRLFSYSFMTLKWNWNYCDILFLNKQKKIPVLIQILIWNKVAKIKSAKILSAARCVWIFFEDLKNNFTPGNILLCDLLIIRRRIGFIQGN